MTNPPTPFNKGGLRGILLVIGSWSLVIVLLGCGGKEAVKGTKGGKELSLAPEFVLADLDGKEVKLSDFKKKVVILDFWATWCVPCKQEIPDFIELYDRYREKGFEIVGISLDRGGPEVVRSFAVDYGISYTLLMDDGKVQKEYGPIEYIPTTFVLDKEHRIYKKYVGKKSKEVFEEDLRTLLD